MDEEEFWKKYENASSKEERQELLAERDHPIVIALTYSQLKEYHKKIMQKGEKTSSDKEFNQSDSEVKTFEK